MATIVAPTDLVGARSPIYITVAEAADTVNTPVDVTIKIFVWSGAYASRPTNPDYTLFRDKFVSHTSSDTFQVAFDIAPMVREEMEGVFDTNITRTSPTGEKNNNIVWVDIDYIFNYYSVATPTVITNTTGSSGTFAVSDGYHEYEEGATAAATDGYLNSTSTVYVKDDGYEMVSTYLGEYGSESIDDVAYKVGGVVKHTFDITSRHLSVQPEDQITRLPIGPIGLNNYLTSDGYTGAASDRPINQDQWEIVLLDSLAAEVATLKVIKQCEPKYTTQTIRFLNKYGTWEFLNFFKRSDDDLEVTSEQFRKSNLTVAYSGVSYDTDIEQYKKFNTNGRVRTTLNTGWISEDHKEAIKQLLVSERVMLDTKPVNVVSSSARLQKAINEKTINYTIEVEEAFDTRYV